jgi:hypothetical protein
MHLKAALPLHPPHYVHVTAKAIKPPTPRPSAPLALRNTKDCYLNNWKCLSFKPKKMDWDDDAPPDLVGTETGLEADEKPVKVPITIVTGAWSLWSVCLCPAWLGSDGKSVQDISAQARRRS